MASRIQYGLPQRILGNRKRSQAHSCHHCIHSIRHRCEHVFFGVCEYEALLYGRGHVSLGVHELFFYVDHEKLVLGHAQDRGALDDELGQRSPVDQHRGYVSNGPQTSHGSEAAHVYHGRARLLFSCACVSLADLKDDLLYLQAVSSAFHVLACGVCVLEDVSYSPGFRPHSQRSSLQKVVLTVSAFSG